MQVTFLRHAQSLFNLHGTSSRDCDLSDLGRQQASDLSGVYDLIIVSPLRRTHQTLTYSNIRGSRLITSHLCREKRTDICDYIEGENMSLKETDEQLRKRIDNFGIYVKNLAKEGDKVLVICHGDFIHAAVGGEYPENASMRTWNYVVNQPSLQG